MIIATDADPAGSFGHPALFYRSDEEYLASLVPFVTEGLRHGHAVAVAVPEPNLTLLGMALHEVIDRVTLIDMGEAGRNPGRIIADVLRQFADQHPDRHVRIIGEPIWAGRTITEYPACAQHEALINRAFAGRDVTILCPYSLRGLDSRVVSDAHATHPVVWTAGARYRSASYDPDSVVARYNQPLTAAPDVPTLTVRGSAEVLAVRRFVADHAHRAGLAAGRLADLELIVTELVTNSLLHARGWCQVRIWTALEHLVCDVRDTGVLVDPLAGRRPVPASQASGRGLLLVNALADLVRTHTTPEGTTIRVQLRLGDA